MLKDQVAIITGGARGIGKSIADKFAENGANLVIVDVNEEVAQQTADEYKAKGLKAIALKVDVSSPEDVDKMVKTVVAEFGKVDILVNNAGVTRDNLMLRMNESDWDLVLNINLKGVFLCTKAVLRPMAKAKGGKIINIASIVGQMGNPGQANYSASKGGVIALTKTTAKEYAKKGIRCNAVAPGYINTEMTRVLSDAAKEAMLSTVPMQTMGEAEDVANASLFLASDLSNYVTGQVLGVNGGMYM